ncbi:MAG: filamentous hemagglutinin N-terminal domain-containing protein [Thioploca sp.]|nr:filamentous hemagglutinin N-terminal domain-containing protein [Thioploca sp.]
MRYYYLHLIGLIITLFTAINSPAEVILDGSWGRHDALTGPQFDIRAELGNQVGNNLFHSFERFNLDAGEIATFSGPNHLENVISRVTGGTFSTLNGTIRSTIPQANMYFINPAGIVLGEQAKIDVPGAIHFSTADTLQLGKAGQFAATHPQTSLLTTAAPTAFGFLSDSPHSISIQGSQLSVTPGKTVSFIGGDIEFNQSQLQAEEGQINLASIASPGLVNPTASGFNLDNTVKTGHLTINDSQLDVSGQGSGSIFIRAGQVHFSNSKLLSNPQGDIAGGTIQIQATDLVVKDSDVSTSTDGPGTGGELTLDVANAIKLSGITGVFSSTRNEQLPAGNAGRIIIKAKELYLTEGAQIAGATFGPGKGGEIDIQVVDIISLSDIAFITVNSQGTGELAGDAGKIIINTLDLTLTQGAQIGSVTFGNGQGGSITINASDTVLIEGFAPGDEEFPIYPSGINVSAIGNGNAGAIELTAKQLHLKDGGAIGSTTYGTGQGDQITLTVTEAMNITGTAKVTLAGTKYTRPSQIESASEPGANQAGQVIINTPLLILTDTGKITTSAQTAHAGKIELQIGQLKLDSQAAITSESAGEGEAGQIHITAKEINVNNAEISTAATQAAGGHITITVPQLLALQAGGTITTSVQGGTGGGGDITITKPTFVILNQAKIKADAHGGNGGNITIDADQYLRSVDSSVTASSQLGTPGEIRITALNTNIGGTLVILPATFLDVSVLLKSLCENQAAGKSSHFVVKTLTGTPPSPDDWKSNRLLAATTPNQATASSTQSATQSSLTFPAVVVAMTCPDSAVKLTSSTPLTSPPVTPTQLF